MSSDVTSTRANGCAFGFVGAVIAVSLLVAYGFGYLPVRLFNAAEWRSVERSSDYRRLHMIDHLRFSGQLDGLTRKQVTDLLGPPSTAGYFKDWDLVYWLGAERGLFGIDSEWLVIRLDKSGRVSDYRTARD